ncbi:MAG: hypothetical protein EHM35_01410 [Planctomycetaceae bacterium]|nr:MAG: hypothetical protein EHM35_01410 [Planctomycetaceae bacterium]
MEPIPGPQIRSIDDAVRDHVEATLAAYGETVPQYRIALELGISPTTLGRWLKEWANGESVIRDRR